MITISQISQQHATTVYYHHNHIDVGFVVSQLVDIITPSAPRSPSTMNLVVVQKKAHQPSCKMVSARIGFSSFPQ